MPTRTFYSNLEVIPNINFITDDSYYCDVPNDWYLLVSDVKNSTKAIENGEYKNVNMVGALAIISILNIKKDFDIPFVFGGDGAFLLVPSYFLKESKQALLHIKKISKESYNLELRVGAIAISFLKESKKSIKIAKLKVSDEYHQAIIKGDALEYGDFLVKSSDEFLIDDKFDQNFKLDITGLECRWKAIKTPKDEVLSLIVKAYEYKDYKEILEEIEKILGDSSQRSPISENRLNLSFDSNDLKVEASIYEKSTLLKSMMILKFKFINLLGKILMHYGVFQWVNYKKRIVNSSDTEKFDGTLRITVASKIEDSNKLEAYLKKLEIDKKIIYGIHKTDSSLMTCLIFERHGKHIHFIDGNNGGYAMASKNFKRKL